METKVGKIAWKAQLIKSLKIAAAAFAAIALAAELGLKYSVTAGIITILSIQNTKQETIRSAAKRWAAFLCALLLIRICFVTLGYTLWAFGAYLFLFALLCLCVGWSEAVAMDSVLITHFLAEQNMGAGMLLNEGLLLLIGTGAGVLVNVHLHKKEKEFSALAAVVDEQIKGILAQMSCWLPKEDKNGYGAECFDQLERAIDAARICAASNYGNSVFSRDAYEIEYISMREQQSILLREIYDNIVRIHYLPEQSVQVARLLEAIGDDYARENTVEGLLDKMDALLVEMREQPLPGSRDEFEARAILFYILMQIKQFLEIKKKWCCFWGQGTEGQGQ